MPPYDQQNPAPQPASPAPAPAPDMVTSSAPQTPLPPLGAMQPAPPTPGPLTTPPVGGVVAGNSQGKSAVPPPRGNPNSTQNALIISEIRDNLVVMNDGTMRAVVACHSINFDLMSEREQEGVEYSYQQFLNSLYFPMQIFVRSQKVDIGPYLDRLSKIRRDQDNMLLGVLMDDYINFISVLAQETNIMEKSFFIIIPYYPAGDMNTAVNSSRNFVANLFAPQKQQHVRIDEAAFTKAKDELRNRVGTITNGLAQMSVRCTQLDTKQLGELFYSVYNPDTAVRQPIGDFEDMGSPVITKGEGNAPQPHLDKELT